MAVLKEFKCLAHGFFDGWEPKCPHGCTGDELIMRVFLTPVGTQSDATRHNDSTLKSLAGEYGMTDIKSVREGEAQPGRFQQPQNPYAVKWGSPSEIGNYNTASIRGESVNGLQSAKETGRINPLMPASVIKDHQNLQIEK
jgi:hypothetical protein